MGRIRIYRTILISLLLAVNCCGKQNLPVHTGQYASAELPTPVFNNPDFPFIFGGGDGRTLHLGKCQQLWQLEFIALPQSVFKVEERIKKGNRVIFRVTTDEYPTAKKLFIDSRFVKTLERKPSERARQLPPRQEIIERLISAKGSAYVWGGNVKSGIPEMLSIYPPSSEIGQVLKEKWMLKGVDCSGLLYEATGGYTPRNTDVLMDYGNPVLIAGLKAKEILLKAEPLDLIVWKGHVIIVLDRKRIIESRLDYDKKTPGCQGGVRVRPLMEALTEIMESREPVNNYKDEAGTGKEKFVIRRWYE